MANSSTVNEGHGGVTTTVDAWLENQTGSAATLCVRTRINGSSDGPWGYGVVGQSGYDGNGADWQEAGRGVLNYGNTVVDGTCRFSVSKTHSGWTASCWAKMWGELVDGYGAYGSSDEVRMAVSVPATTKYTVTYLANGGTGAPAAQTKWHGEALTLSSTIPTRTGYTFLGWATSSAGAVAYMPGTVYGAAANTSITLYAAWKQNTWTVSYNANGGTGAPASQTKTYGVTLTLSSTIPTRTGYTFIGWATSSSGGVAYASGSAYTANSAVTLYAVWQLIVYSVTYNANGGSNPPDTQTKVYGQALTLSSVQPTRAGHTFKGWAISASSTVIAYAPGASYTTNSPLSLYAVWQINTWTVSFNANGGTGAPSSQTKTYNIDLTLSTTEPTMYRYIFLGWATSKENADKGLVGYRSGGVYSNNSASTLYAVWRLNYIEPTISNLVTERCLEDGTVDVNGTYVRVTCNWAVDTSITSTNRAHSVTVDYMVTDATTEQWINQYDEAPETESGNIDIVIGEGNISLAKAYYIRVSVVDDGEGFTRQSMVSTPYRPFDIGNKGKSIAIGKPAPDDEELFECALPAEFQDGVICDSLSFNINNTPTKMGGFITVQGSVDNTDSKSQSWHWRYKKYNNGTVQMWGRVAGTALTSVQCVFPITLSGGYTYVLASAVTSSSSTTASVNPAVVTNTGCYIVTSASISGAINVYVEGAAS